MQDTPRWREIGSNSRERFLNSAVRIKMPAAVHRLTSMRPAEGVAPVHICPRCLPCRLANLRPLKTPHNYGPACRTRRTLPLRGKNSLQSYGLSILRRHTHERATRKAHTPNRQTRKQARSLSLSLLECSREAFQSQTSSRLPLCTAVLYCETSRRD